MASHNPGLQTVGELLVLRVALRGKRNQSTDPKRATAARAPSAAGPFARLLLIAQLDWESVVLWQPQTADALAN